MRVLFDYSGFAQRVGGVSRYLCEIIEHLPEDIVPKISVKQSDCVYLWEKMLKSDLTEPRFTANNYLPFDFKGKRRLFRLIEDSFARFPSVRNVNQNYSIEMIKEGNFDVLHHTQYDPYFLPFIGKKPYVITIHDCIHEVFNTGKAYSDGKKALIPGAAHIIAISNKTKSDLMEIYNVPEEKITVIYHGGPQVIFDDSAPIVDGRYFLFVGRRHTYKNFIQTLRDFSLTAAKHKDIKLVCTGTPFNSEELGLIRELKVENRVIQKFASERELANLYKHAVGFIFPSIYEGFGLPILEAYSYLCPTLLNHTSCFPELAGDAAIYFNSSHGESDLPDALERALSMSESERNDLINKQLGQLKMYSWHNAAEQTAEVYRKVLG